MELFTALNLPAKNFSNYPYKNIIQNIENAELRIKFAKNSVFPI